MKHYTRNIILFSAAALAGAVGGCVCISTVNVAGIIICTTGYVMSLVGLFWSLDELLDSRPRRALPPGDPRAGPWWL